MSEKKIGERIRLVRKNTGCNQKEFDSLLNIPQSTLSAYETNRMQPTVASLIIIAEKFNVSLDWLCGVECGNGKKAEQEIDNSSSELPDDLKKALDDATKFLQELAAMREGENKSCKKLRKTPKKEFAKGRDGK